MKRDGTPQRCALTAAQRLAEWEVAAAAKRVQVQAERVAKLTGVPPTVLEVPGQLDLF